MKNRLNIFENEIPKISENNVFITRLFQIKNITKIEISVISSIIPMNRYRTLRQRNTHTNWNSPFQQPSTYNIHTIAYLTKKRSEKNSRLNDLQFLLFFEKRIDYF